MMQTMHMMIENDTKDAVIVSKKAFYDRRFTDCQKTPEFDIKFRGF